MTVISFTFVIVYDYDMDKQTTYQLMDLSLISDSTRNVNNNICIAYECNHWICL